MSDSASSAGDTDSDDSSSSPSSTLSEAEDLHFTPAPDLSYFQEIEYKSKQCIRQALSLYHYLTHRSYRICKGLLRAVEETWQDSHHFFCFRHLCDNLNKAHKDPRAKELAWEVAKANSITHATSPASAPIAWTRP
jgi:hypothetical protein